MRRLLRCDLLLPRAGARAIADAGILIEDERVVGVGDFETVAASTPRAEAEALSGLAIPGLIDAHTHLRGATPAEQGIVGGPLEEWLCRLTAASETPLEDDAAAGAGRALASGVTSVQAMLHSWAGAEERLAELDAVAQATDRFGLRALLVLGLTDRAEYAPSPVPSCCAQLPSPQRGLEAEEWGEFVREAERRTAGMRRVRIGVGPVAPQWCSDAVLRAIAASRGSARVHTHLLESPLQRRWVDGEPGPLARLERAGLLGDFCSVAHGVHLERQEAAALGAAGAAIVHCPVSNAVLGVGAADVSVWGEAGATAALGLDSQGAGRPDPFATMRTARDTARAVGAELSAEDALAMATTGGASALGLPAGEIRPGALADLALLDLDPGTLDAATTAVVERARTGSVSGVVVGGEPIVAARFDAMRADADAAHERLLHALDADASARAERLRRLEPSLRGLETYRRRAA